MQNFSTLFYPSSVALVNAKDIASNITVNIVNGAEITDLSAKALDAYDIALTYQSVSSTYLTAIPANLSLTSVNATVILSGGVDLKNIFLTSETDSQTLTYISSSYNLSISNGNNVNLSSIVVSPNTDTIFRTVSAIALSGVFYGDGSNLIGASLPGQAQINTTVQTNSAGWNTAYNTATIYSTTSGSFATNTTVNNISSILTPLILTNTLTGQLVTNTDFTNYQTSVAGSTATLLPTSIYQNASGNWQNAYTNLVTNSAAYLTGVDLTFLQQPSANWNSTYTTVQNTSTEWNTAFNRSTIFANVSGRYDSTSTVVQAGSSNWYSASAAARGYTHQNFLPLSGGVIDGSLYVLSSLYVLGSAFTVNTQDLTVKDPIIYIADDNQTDILDLGIMASWTNGSYPAGYQHGGLVRRQDNKTWTLFSGATAEPVSGVNVNWNQTGITLEPLSAKFYGDIYGDRNVFGSLSASGNLSAASITIGPTLNCSSNQLNLNLAGNATAITFDGTGTPSPGLVIPVVIANGDLTLASGRTGSGNIILRVPSGNSVEQRNGLNTQTYRIYNRYTDASNYQRGTFTLQNSALVLGTEYTTTAGNSALSGQAMPIILAPGYNQSLSATAPVVLQQTWNNTNNTFTLLSANVIDNASNSSSRLLDLQTNGTSVASINKVGSIAGRSLQIVAAHGSGIATNIYGHSFSPNANSAIQSSGIYWPSTFLLYSSYGLYLNDGAAIGWATGNLQAPVANLELRRDANNTLALRNGLSAQTFRIYNTYTAGTPVSSEFGYTQWSGNTFQIGTSSTGSGQNRDINLIPSSNVVEQVNDLSAQTFRIYNTLSATNFERGFMRWNSNVLQIGTERGGNGSQRNLEFNIDGNAPLTLFTSAAMLASTASLWVNQRLIMDSEADGNLRLRNWSGTGFGLLRLGGSTSSFPALKRSDTGLQVRLANDSDFAPLSASVITAVSGINITGNLSAVNVIASGDITANRIQATVKNFYIDHPTKPGKHLVYSSLESPYNGVQLTGEGEVVNGQCVVELPDYISSLIRSNNIHIQLTNYKHSKTLYVDSIEVDKNRFTVKCDAWTSKFKTLKFFWTLNGVRKDVEELQTEV